MKIITFKQNNDWKNLSSTRRESSIRMELEGLAFFASQQRIVNECQL
jgi:hypothetical protein